MDMVDTAMEHMEAMADTVTPIMVPMAATAAMPPPTMDTTPLPTLRDMATALTLLPTTTMLPVDMNLTTLTEAGILILLAPAPTPLATSLTAMATSPTAMAMSSTLLVPPSSTTVFPATSNV